MNLTDFDHVIFDLDSTLVTIEGIDELARKKGVYDQISAMTKRAMDGNVSLDKIFYQRLQIIKPRYHDLISLGYQYIGNITPGAIETIRDLKRKHIGVYLVSGGLNPAVNMVARFLGILPKNIYAEIIDKKPIVRNLRKKYSGTFALVGDSSTDYEAGQLTDRFIYFSGVVTRIPIMKKSTHILRGLVLDRTALSRED